MAGNLAATQRFQFTVPKEPVVLVQGFNPIFTQEETLIQDVK